MSTTGVLSQILYNDNSGKPVLINFQNGNLSADKLKEFKCGLYVNEEDHFIPAVASNKMLYSGRISRNEELYNNFILTHNKKTGKCKLIKIDKALLSIITKTKRKLDAEETPKIKQLSDLNKYFGSKRTKMVTEQKERLKVDVENIKTSLEQTAKEAKVAESDIVPFKPDENDSLYRPPINRNASRVEDVYPLDVLVPNHILEELRGSAEKLLEAPEDELKFCEFVKKEFVKLQNSSSANVTTKARILLYVDCLVSLIKQQARSVSSKKFVACPYSGKVSAYILDNFTLMSSTGRTRPLSMRDKCICYVLVLSMLAFNNAVNLEIFTKDLKLGTKKLQDVSRVLGFTFKGSDRNNVALSLPLPPPVTASTGKKQRR